MTASEHQPLDPRLMLLARAAARLTLFESGELDLDGACEGLIDMDWTFLRACDIADAKARKIKPDPKIERLRALMNDDVSLEHMWAELNANRPMPDATIEAVKQAVRDRGVAALDESATRERLARCDAKALKAIDRWLIDFEREGFDQCSSSTPSSPS